MFAELHPSDRADAEAASGSTRDPAFPAARAPHPAGKPGDEGADQERDTCCGSTGSEGARRGALSQEDPWWDSPNSDASDSDGWWPGSACSDDSQHCPAPRRDARLPPETLRVDLEGHGARDSLGVAGVYRLQARRTPTNEMPVWKKSGCNERWLFSCTTRRWCIHGSSAEAVNFQMSDPRANWLWLDVPHGGYMPHQLPALWERWGVRQPEDAGISIRAAVA